MTGASGKPKAEKSEGPVPPISPRHPSDDAMPPYAPGGVPEPSRDPAASPDSSDAGSTLPPRQKP